jgi:putative hydrolase of the HAD superfamily
MEIRALVFDVNGTLVDIETNEGLEEIYRVLANLLGFQGIAVGRGELRDLYFQVVGEQPGESVEAHPELDVVAVWREILARKASDFTRELPPEKYQQLPLFLAETHRALARLRLQLFPDVRKVLERLQENYPLAIVTNGMSAYSLPELRILGIADLFNPIIVSGDYGYRKPDPRLFEQALHRLQVHPEQAVYVGNDLEQDVGAARQVGMKTVFFASNQKQIDPFSTQADYVIYHFADLSQALHFLTGR